MPDGLLPILSNRPEITADRDLQEVVSATGDRLYSKVPLSEVVDIDDPGVAAVADRRFLLMASFDFVIARANYAIFSVEIDGRQHSSDAKTIERDRKKDMVCEAAHLPILRITSDLAANRTGRRSILKYVADSYYLHEAFVDAQVSGIVPFDEPFFRSSFVEFSSNGQPEGAIDEVAIRYISDMHDAGKFPVPVPDIIVVSVPERRNVRCLTYLAVAKGRLVFADVQARDFRFVGIRPSELVESLALLELMDGLQRWVDGGAAATDCRRLNRALAEIQAAIDTGLYRSGLSYRSNHELAGELLPLTIRFGGGSSG